MNRRGVTLIELLVALALSALVATAVLQTLVGTQRISHAGTQRIDVQQNLRAGLGYLGTALRELNAADSDITVATDTKLAFRTMRWVGIMCAAPAAGPGTTVVLPVRQSPLFGLRQPNPNEDSVLVFQELDSSPPNLSPNTSPLSWSSVRSMAPDHRCRLTLVEASHNSVTLC